MNAFTQFLAEWQWKLARIRTKLPLEQSSVSQPKLLVFDRRKTAKRVMAASHSRWADAHIRFWFPSV